MLGLQLRLGVERDRPPPGAPNLEGHAKNAARRLEHAGPPWQHYLVRLPVRRRDALLRLAHPELRRWRPLEWPAGAIDNRVSGRPINRFSSALLTLQLTPPAAPPLAPAPRAPTPPGRPPKRVAVPHAAPQAGQIAAPAMRQRLPLSRARAIRQRPRPPKGAAAACGPVALGMAARPRPRSQNRAPRVLTSRAGRPLADPGPALLAVPPRRLRAVTPAGPR